MLTWRELGLSLELEIRGELDGEGKAGTEFFPLTVLEKMGADVSWMRGGREGTCTGGAEDMQCRRIA